MSSFDLLEDELNSLEVGMIYFRGVDIQDFNAAYYRFTQEQPQLAGLMNSHGSQYSSLSSYLELVDQSIHGIEVHWTSRVVSIKIYSIILCRQK